MNVLDENIPRNQRCILQNLRIRVRQIGYDIGYSGIKDEEIIPFLHQIGKVTFFTRDLRFYQYNLCHPRYCLICLAINDSEVASFIQRFLRHPAFNTQSKRMGKVIRVSHNIIRTWQLHVEKEQDFAWK